MAEIKDYSVTADDNDSASPNGMPEGMAPSGVNNSWRESFARVKRWYEDIQGAKTTTGSSNAYVLAAARVVTAYAAGDAYMFKANHTCTAAGSTLNVDSLGAKSIVTPAGAALGAGDITSGGIYIVAYEASADKFMLLGGSSTFSGDITAKTSDGAILNLQTSDTTVTSGSVLGRIDYQAPNEASGTDAILLAASISAIATDTFAADNNSCKLSFQTATSAAAAETMSLSSGGNLTLPTDGVVIAAGVNSDVTLTHVHDTGLLLNSTMALQFNDASQYINAPSATVLDINATDEIELNATLADVNANLDVSGTYQGGGTMTTGGNIVIPDAGNIGTASDTDAIAISSAGVVSLSATTEASATGTAAVTLAGGLGVAKDMWIGDDIVMDSDACVLKMGADQDLTLTHAADVSLTVASAGATTDLIVNNTATDGDPTVRWALSGTDKFTMGVDDGASDSLKIGAGGGLGTPYFEMLSTGHMSFGTNAAADGTGAYFYNNTTDEIGVSIRQDNASNNTSALYSVNDAAQPAIRGLSAGNTIYSVTSSAAHGAVYGIASNSSHYTLLGYSTHGCYATSVYCVGALYKGSGTFRIPHGLREDYDLLHSFVEGPQCDLIYRGTVDLVDGRATVSMDTKYGMTAGTFAWLTKDIQTFTSNETGWDAVKSSFSGDTITIECQNADSTDTISWMVVAERDDPNIKASEITDSDGNLIIERPSEPAPPSPG